MANRVRESDVLGLRHRERGDETSGEIATRDARTVTLIADRGNLPAIDGEAPAAEVAKLQIQFSDDEGSSWRHLAGCGVLGSGELDENGVVITEASVTTKLPRGRSRMVRGRLRTLRACDTACHFEFEE